MLAGGMGELVLSGWQQGEVVAWGDPACGGDCPSPGFVSGSWRKRGGALKFLGGVSLAVMDAASFFLRHPLCSRWYQMLFLILPS